MEQKEGRKIDLLLCCGDFQAVRNMDDLETMACPAKYRAINTFYKYYSGEKVAPYPTIFIGGNHEASNYLWELYYGGWAAPNIWFMGFAGAIKFGGVRIAGLSGIFKQADYSRGHHESLPYTDSTIRSIYHVRDYEVYRLMQMKLPIDVFLSHDWPRNIVEYGDKAALLRKKPFLQADIANGSLGSAPNEQLLSALQPSYWFSAHLHTKFPAIMAHPPASAQQQQHKGGGGSSTGSGSSGGSGGSSSGGPRATRFLALDKCLPGREFLQVLELDASGPLEFEYDEEWLAILRSTSGLTNLGFKHAPLPGMGSAREGPSQADLLFVKEAMSQRGGAGVSPDTFVPTAPAHDASVKSKQRPTMPVFPLRNPQTEAFLQMLQLPYDLAHGAPNPHARANPNASPSTGNGSSGGGSSGPRAGIGGRGAGSVAFSNASALDASVLQGRAPHAFGGLVPSSVATPSGPLPPPPPRSAGASLSLADNPEEIDLGDDEEDEGAGRRGDGGSPAAAEQLLSDCGRPTSGKWWAGYTGQTHVIIDEVFQDYCQLLGTHRSSRSSSVKHAPTRNPTFPSTLQQPSAESPTSATTAISNSAPSQVPSPATHSQLLSERAEELISLTDALSQHGYAATLICNSGSALLTKLQHLSISITSYSDPESTVAARQSTSNTTTVAIPVSHPSFFSDAAATPSPRDATFFASPGASSSANVQSHDGTAQFAGCHRGSNSSTRVQSWRSVFAQRSTRPPTQSNPQVPTPRPFPSQLLQPSIKPQQQQQQQHQPGPQWQQQQQPTLHPTPPQQPQPLGQLSVPPTSRQQPHWLLQHPSLYKQQPPDLPQQSQQQQCGVVPMHQAPNVHPVLLHHQQQQQQLQQWQEGQTPFRSVQQAQLCHPHHFIRTPDQQPWTPPPPPPPPPARQAPTHSAADPVHPPRPSGSSIANSLASAFCLGGCPPPPRSAVLPPTPPPKHPWVTDLILDPNFREVFSIHRPTQRYSRVLAALPPVFVGPTSRLQQLVRVLCAEMGRAIIVSGLDVAPWRRCDVVMTRWVSHTPHQSLLRVPVGSGGSSVSVAIAMADCAAVGGSGGESRPAGSPNNRAIGGGGSCGGSPGVMTRGGLNPVPTPWVIKTPAALTAPASLAATTTAPIASTDTDTIAAAQRSPAATSAAAGAATIQPPAPVEIKRSISHGSGGIARIFRSKFSNGGGGGGSSLGIMDRLCGSLGQHLTGIFASSPRAGNQRPHCTLLQSLSTEDVTSALQQELGGARRKHGSSSSGMQGAGRDSDCGIQDLRSSGSRSCTIGGSSRTSSASLGSMCMSADRTQAAAASAAAAAAAAAAATAAVPKAKVIQRRASLLSAQLDAQKLRLAQQQLLQERQAAVDAQVTRERADRAEVERRQRYTQLLRQYISAVAREQRTTPVAAAVPDLLHGSDPGNIPQL
ncbi:MAG: hypothetical protein WDW36_007716 [Sanguina aurantia]